MSPSARPLVVLLLASFASFASLVLAGCAPKPPRGTPVKTTTMAASEAPEIPSKKDWYVWHQEGLRRLALAQRNEALFCFHKALDLWPKELPEAERTMRPPLIPAPTPIPEHRPAPLDTLLKLAELYIAMNEPAWALFYLDEFDRVMPGKGHLTKSLRVQALAIQTPIVKGKQAPKPKAERPPAPSPAAG